jgi:hypothetical protein
LCGIANSPIRLLGKLYGEGRQGTKKLKEKKEKRKRRTNYPYALEKIATL